jgi:hypothetical protein
MNKLGIRPFQHLQIIDAAIWNIPSCDTYCLVVLIEATFRTFAHRSLEYFWLYILLSIKSSKAARVTIGLNQLRYDHWLQYLKLHNESTSFGRLLRACESLSEARGATEWYLRMRGFSGGRDGVSISRIYTGRRNLYYDQLFFEASKLLRKYQSRRIYSLM